MPHLLKLTDLTGAQYRVSVVKEKLVMPDDNPSMGTWMLDLRATDWRIQAETLTSTAISLPQSGGVIFFPLTFPITFGASSGGSATITNTGTVEASPIITINGPTINPVISNDTTGERLGLNLTLVSGDQVVIDMDNATIVQGSTNRMGNKATGSRFWSLSSGANTIRFSADAYDVGTAVITFRSALLGL